MTNQRDLRMTYPSGDVYTTNLVMHWPVTETWPATKQPPEIIFTVVLCIFILSKFINLPNKAQENCFKKNIKIYIKTAPTCFCSITIIRERII
jgi:hypothetical protein